MTMKKIFLMMILAVMVSCVQETVEQKKVTVTLGNVKMKTAFTSGRDALVWENGDRLGFYHDGDGLQNTLMEYAGSSEMTLNIPFDAENIYSLFPYDGGAGENPAQVNVCIPSAQTQDTPGVLDGKRWPMAASGHIENDRATLTFRPLTALLALNIYSSEPSDGEAVTKVCITPTVNSGFCGNAAVNITSASATITSGDSSQPVTLSVTNPKALVSEKPSDPKTFEDQLHVCIARQSYTYVKFEIFTSAGKLYTLTSNSNAIDCVSDDITALNINLSKGKIHIVRIGSTEEMTEVDGTLTSLEEVIRDPVADDISKDIIPDFSRVGYHYGDDEIPHYDNVIATLYPTGDTTDRADDIQKALDAADGVTNSVVLLTEGDYYVKSKISILKNHLVLRGEGGGFQDADGNIIGWKTRLIATGDSTMRSCIAVGPERKSPLVTPLSSVDISEPYVPVGRLSLCVRDASGFNVGDRISIFRPATWEWIHDIRMDQISDGENWSTSNRSMSFERTIVKIIGNRLYLDSPTVMAFDEYYGGGCVAKVSIERVVESGVEDLFVESTYDPSVTLTYASSTVANKVYPGAVVCVDENHCQNGVKFTSCEHCWATRISGRHFVANLVGMGGGSKNITVTDCHSREPISLIQGSRRYAFGISDATMGLFIGCTADKDRHSFVPVSGVPGPNVFTECRATNCFNETAPHCYWSAGVLYDCIVQDTNRIGVQDSDYSGTGGSHGWQGTCVVIWNCEAPEIVCQSPWTAQGRNPTGRNYCIGSIGKKRLSTRQHPITGEWLNDRPQGEWVPDPGKGNSNTEHITSGTYFGATAKGLSLYKAQLEARKEAGIRAIPAEWYK